ncbi:MAG TPA: quinone-dependent dihydroorotate dehydrogenase [Myxococcales bacterium]|nr:quinone-dependent dihydroorotate dehydrogenase [Myxococcales bacterium]
MYRLVRPLLFLLGPETAHGLAGGVLRLRRAPRTVPGANPALRQTLWGIDFPTPLGLAAGMDKGQALAGAWFALGFGWVEIGTVTPQPQPGNDRPRLFRLVRERAVINRMGFNNDGAAAVAERLRRLPRLPGPLCVNVGRNKITPNERAAGDYLAAFRALAPFAQLASINVSSPNTPGLRALQAELGALVAEVVKARDSLPRRIPVLVKLSPDEPDDRLVEMARAAEAAGSDGIIATNTTLDRAAVQGHPRAGEQGGLSGAPLRDRAQHVCKLLYRAVKVPIVGVGGISTAEDAYARIRAGASLIQLYTALIYQGPGLPRRISKGLTELLSRDRLTLQQAIGADAGK